MTPGFSLPVISCNTEFCFHARYHLDGSREIFQMADESLENSSFSADGETKAGGSRGNQGENRGILRSRYIYSWKRGVSLTHTHTHTLEATLVMLLNNATAWSSKGLLLY